MVEQELDVNCGQMKISTTTEKKDYCRATTLFHILEGNAIFEYDNQKYELKETDIVIVNRGCEYAYEGSSTLMIANLELKGKMFESICDGIRFFVKCNSSRDQSAHYEQLRVLLRQMMLNQLYIEEDKIKYSYLVFESYSLYYKLLETVVAYFIEGGNGHLGQSMDPLNKDLKRKEEIERYLNLNYMEAISLDDISKELFISKGYLSKYFIRCFGMSFSQYLKELRLRHAVIDLQYTKKTITQISFDNGFSSSSFFNRAFREKFKKNPSEIRSELLNESETSIQVENNELIHERLNKWLAGEAQPSGVVEQKERTSFSVSESVYSESCWNNVINIGSASDILRTDMQEHIKILSKYFKYARFWDPFSERMLLDVNGDQENCNFLRLDQVIDSLLDVGMKPFILFEPKLERINSDINSVIIKSEHRTTINDIDSWKKIISALMKHWVQKYGKEELEQWKFELSYGVYRLKDKEPLDSFMELFLVMSNIICEHAKGLMLGGPALPSCEQDILKKIISEMKEKECLPDFISMISFAYEVNEYRHRYSIRSADEDYLIDDVKKICEMLDLNGLSSIPLYITEWNDTVADRNFINDSCYRAAYMVKSFLEINQFVSVIGYFSGTDLRSEYFDSRSLLQGGNGILNRNGILKPSGFAIKLMDSLAKNKIVSGKHFLATTDNQDNYYIVAHNKRKLSYYYYKTPEDKIEKEKIAMCYADEDFLEHELELREVPNDEYRVRIHKVNSHFGSILDLWKDLEYSDSLSRKDIMYLQKICEPHLLFKTIKVTNNCLPLKMVMEPNEIMLIEIERTFQ